MFRHLRIVILVSLVYDLALGLALLLFPCAMAARFGVASPSQPLLANLLGLFALTVAACYLLPLRDPARFRPLLWFLGPLLKGAGALIFIADHFLRGSPSAFLLFALADGALAVWTGFALRRPK